MIETSSITKDGVTTFYSNVTCDECGDGKQIVGPPSKIPAQLETQGWVCGKTVQLCPACWGKLFLRVTWKGG